MNKEISADIKSLKFIFERNKLYLFPSVVILLSIVLFLQFIIPQFKTLMSARNEAEQAKTKLSNLKSSLNTLTNANDDSLDSQLKTVNLALPSNKDFGGMLNAIYYVSGEAGVSLGSFSFRIGDISESESGGILSTIDVSLPVKADITKINEFAKIISNTLPLSEVSLIKIGDQASTINLSFYYKPLSPIDNVVSGDIRIDPISQKELSLLNELSTFKSRPSFSNTLVNVNASSSAEPTIPL